MASKMVALMETKSGCGSDTSLAAFVVENLAPK